MMKEEGPSTPSSRILVIFIFVFRYLRYYQVQKWLGYELNPEDWRWIMITNILEPIQTFLSTPDIFVKFDFLQLLQRLWSKLWLQENGLH
ncbi:hypothetical protein G5I_03478 [Acromyrmex echinatior]|uniref:Uncharacterized protein n=1 Tax=Acromyrmex echinatior TaxID=103372 RepID=F4WD32_ACREC|nr:hypothetical protein G5I_03478 [Acromyrmex echinatior]